MIGIPEQVTAIFYGCAAALLWLYDQRGEGPDPGNVEEALIVCKYILGWETCLYISSWGSRKSVMKHLNKDLKPLCKGTLPDRGSYLFGDKFGTKAAKKKANKIKVLKGVI